jgi:hypothetical protein
MKGAKGVLINITGGLDMTLFEVDEAANRIREEVDEDANIIFGATFDDRTFSGGADFRGACPDWGGSLFAASAPAHRRRYIAGDSHDAARGLSA